MELSKMGCAARFVRGAPHSLDIFVCFLSFFPHNTVERHHEATLKYRNVGMGHCRKKELVACVSVGQPEIVQVCSLPPLASTFAYAGCANTGLGSSWGGEPLTCRYLAPCLRRCTTLIRTARGRASRKNGRRAKTSRKPMSKRVTPLRNSKRGHQKLAVSPPTFGALFSSFGGV